MPATGLGPGGASSWSHWGLSVTHWGLYPPAKGQEHCGSQSQCLAGRGLCAGIRGWVTEGLPVPLIPKPGKGVCLCLQTNYKIEFKFGHIIVKYEAAGCAEMPPLSLFVVQIISALCCPFQVFV